MKLSFVQPRPELRPYVESLWVFESAVGMPPEHQSLAAPDGCPKLIFLENSLTSVVNGRSQVSRAGLYFVGNRSRPALLRSSAGRLGFIGIEFYPQGAFPFFGIPMSETANRLFDADTLFDRWGRQTAEKLRNLGTAPHKVARIQDELVGLLRRRRGRNSLVEFCVNALKSADGRLPMQQLQRQTGYTRRYLERLFQRHVGFPPKVLAGIFRFQKFYRKWAQGQSYDDLKCDLYDDYYDEAHFCKEFKRMTGYSPRQFTRDVTNEFGRRLILK
jgi:methylphosphotriester-DNA--protein-cysteine methyltransferase